MFDGNKKKGGDTLQEDFFALGRQLTIEYYECAPEVFLKTDSVERIMLDAAQQSGATIVSSSFHKFEPQGVSGVIVIAESHFTIHAWPEHDYAAIDIFTCADKINLEVGIEFLKQAFGSQRMVISSDQNRGIIGRSGPEKEKTPEKELSQILNNPRVHPISWQSVYEEKKPWGVLASVDVYNCDPFIMKDVKMIKEFVYILCDRFRMKRRGECQVLPFGEAETFGGISMTQLIENSLISGHFSHATHSAYLDIFSCKFYDPREVAEFAKSFFKGAHYKMQVSLRE